MQDVRLAIRLAENLKGCRELSVSRPSAIADAVRIQLGNTHARSPKRTAQPCLTSGVEPALTNSWFCFNCAKVLPYDNFDPHYRAGERRTCPRSQAIVGSDPLFCCRQLIPIHQRRRSLCRVVLNRSFVVCCRGPAAADSLPRNVETARLASFANTGM